MPSAIAFAVSASPYRITNAPFIYSLHNPSRSLSLFFNHVVSIICVWIYRHSIINSVSYTARRYARHNDQPTHLLPRIYASSTCNASAMAFITSGVHSRSPRSNIHSAPVVIPTLQASCHCVIFRSWRNRRMRCHPSQSLDTWLHPWGL